MKRETKQHCVEVDVSGNMDCHSVASIRTVVIWFHFVLDKEGHKVPLCAERCEKYENVLCWVESVLLKYESP